MIRCGRKPKRSGKAKPYSTRLIKTFRLQLRHRVLTASTKWRRTLLLGGGNRRARPSCALPPFPAPPSSRAAVPPPSPHGGRAPPAQRLLLRRGAGWDSIRVLRWGERRVAAAAARSLPVFLSQAAAPSLRPAPWRCKRPSEPMWVLPPPRPFPSRAAWRGARRGGVRRPARPGLLPRPRPRESVPFQAGLLADKSASSLWLWRVKKGPAKRADSLGDVSPKI